MPTADSTRAKFGPLPVWPWVVAWVVVIAAGLAVVVSTVYVTARIITNG